METESPSIDYILSNYPIVQAVHFLIVLISLPPVILLLIQLRKIALHDNCKFLMHAWVAAFLLSISSHFTFIVCDFINGKYITEKNDDPPIRLLIFAVHGFAHAMSSAQELMLSIERAVSCVFPQQYHHKRLAKRNIFVSETISVFVSMAFLWQISNANILLGCYIINAIDLASLICLSGTTGYVVRRKKSILESSLAVNYQIREAFEITKVMLPCGAISLVMKVISTLGPWAYALGLFESRYMFTITSGVYLITESLNCMICSTVVLLGHAELRRIMQRPLRRKNAVAPREEDSTERARIMHFEELRRQWN